MQRLQGESHELRALRLFALALADSSLTPLQKVHQELFPLQRLPSGREWEDVVLPVMRRWERFVRLVAVEPGHG